MSNANKVFYCETCERDAVVCGKCGNNTCNGGHGKLKDGTECDQCEGAYQQDSEAGRLLLERE